MFQPIDRRPNDTPFDVSRLCRAVGGIASGAAIFVADARLADAPVVFINRPFTRTTGLLRDDVLGRSWTLLSTCWAAPAERAASIESGRPFVVELPNLGSDDGAPIAPFAVHALRDRADRITAYVGVGAPAARDGA